MDVIRPSFDLDVPIKLLKTPQKTQEVTINKFLDKDIEISIITKQPLLGDVIS